MRPRLEHQYMQSVPQTSPGLEFISVAETDNRRRQDGALRLNSEYQGILMMTRKRGVGSEDRIDNLNRRA
jgi:hypothetical protein